MFNKKYKKAPFDFLMPLDRRGQGLSLNVIIVAALALIVLVVLIMVFTGRIAVFEKGVSKEAQAELIKMKITYGDCRPTATDEAEFTVEYGQADSVETEESAKSNFESVINSCKYYNSKDDCESGGCKWS